MHNKALVALLLIVGSISFLACGFSQPVTQTPVSNAVLPLLQAPISKQTLDPVTKDAYATAFFSLQETTTAAAQSTPNLLRVKLYLVAIGDNGKTGQKIGCGDSLIAVDRDIPRTGSPLRDTLTLLFSLKDQHYGQSGLSNALYQSDLKVDGISSHDGVFKVDLSGKVQLGGECDNPRFAAQITRTIMQFATVQRADVYINGKPLENILSEK